MTPREAPPLLAGAERLIVDAAVELAGHGHTVGYFCVLSMPLLMQQCLHGVLYSA